MILEGLIIVAVAAAVSVLVLIGWAWLAPDPERSLRLSMQQAEDQTVFLFDGVDLVDCTPPARQLLEDLPTGGNDLARFLRGLGGRFDGLPSAERIRDEALEGEFLSRDPSEDLRLHLENWNGHTRATLAVHSGENPFDIPEDRSIAQADELFTLRAVADEAPMLVWQTDLGGEITWANEAYLAEVEARAAGDRTHWPPARLFPGAHIEPPGPEAPKRIELRGGVGDGESVAYDVHCARRETRRLYFALSAQAAVRAERTQRNFVQTLTKTFAHLSIGLAIFDKKRRMVLFNPALLDLLQLPVDFLALQPTLHAFLDRLREAQLIAEPKDYKAWRKQIVDLESQAVDGSYCETWNLPGGMTFRVTGRPHPDGAIAFLFEDISAEMLLTRRFNAEIELGHAALDAVDEAILVINDTGVVALTNRAYRELWDADPGGSLVVTRMRDVAETWREIAGDSPVWNTLVKAVEDRSDQPDWQGHVSTRDGRFLVCRTQKLSNGAMLVGFQELKRRRPQRGVAAS